ncbi:MAG: hypothetical protein GVY18_01005, partial [Bacteroidetes bacterium]|nr:hypothetical protein [Bacteroidota bacterium]
MVLLVALSLALLPVQRSHAQPATAPQEPIAPVVLRAGMPDTLAVADLFYAPSYDVSFEASPAIALTYDPAAQQFVLRPEPDHRGLSLLTVRQHGAEYLVPVRTLARIEHVFRYTPDETPAAAHVIGGFNDWSRTATPLTDDDGDGTFTATVHLEPGQYEYKFVVDGAEVLDPENPNRVPNPFGDFNNVLDVATGTEAPPTVHLVETNRAPGQLTFTFGVDGLSDGAVLRPENVLALVGNSLLSARQVTLDGKQVIVTLTGEDLRGRTVLRVAVRREGQASRFQTIRLHDGVPLGTDDAPFSWHDAVIYSIMIDRFHDGDPSNTRPVDHPEVHPQANYHGGDLKGILDKMETGYFDSLGVNVLWVSPVNQNTYNAFPEYPEPHRYFTGYHGYWPIHHQHVDARFGDMELLRTLVERGEERGIRILLDFVANHVHMEHPFFLSHPEWFGSVDLPDGSRNLRRWDEYRLTTWFDNFLPSFDFEGSEEALEVMSDNVVWWLQQTGAAGFRHDAVKHIPNAFWRMQTRKILEEVDRPTGRRTYQIGETFGSYDLISSYVNNGQLDAQFNFNLYDVAQPVFLDREASFARLDAEQDRTFEVYGVDHLMGNVMDSHDKVRFMAKADGDVTPSTDATAMAWSNPPEVDDPASYRRAQLYLAWTLTIPGVPVVYYGDEIGMTGAADPDNRRPMRFGADVTPVEKDHFAQVRDLVHLRRTHPALRYGDFHTLQADEAVYAYVRSSPTERVLVVLNKSETPKTVT